MWNLSSEKVEESANTWLCCSNTANSAPCRNAGGAENRGEFKFAAADFDD